MARTHLRVAARPDVWSDLVAYVITAETAVWERSPVRRFAGHQRPAGHVSLNGFPVNATGDLHHGRGEVRRSQFVRHRGLVLDDQGGRG